MEFLKEVLGEELYNQVLTKINAHNGDEANKDKKIKLANLETGEYVGKNKYSSLEQDLQSKIAELGESNKLIEALKKSEKGNEGLQGKISQYEQTIQNLQAQLTQEKLNNAIKVNLLGAKATDLEYLTFKLNGQGELKLNEQGEIEGWDEKLTALKTQFPSFFEGTSTKVYEGGKLPENNQTQTLTKQELLKKPYHERQQIFEENPKLFNELMK